MREEHQIVQQIREAKTDTGKMDALIRQYLPFIKSETAKFINRMPIEGQDDELGIAMFAFYEAVTAYETHRGAFLKLAAVAIRNRLIDYYRKEQRHAGNLSLDKTAAGTTESGTLMDQVDTGCDELEEYMNSSVVNKELCEFSSRLKEFGLSLSEIADSCPKQERTLATCMRALEYARQNPELLEQLLHSKRLPIAQLTEGIGGERKTLERHRKYLVAVLLAYTNGYEIIRGHLCQIKREGVQA